MHHTWFCDAADAVYVFLRGHDIGMRPDLPFQMKTAVDLSAVLWQVSALIDRNDAHDRTISSCPANL